MTSRTTGSATQALLRSIPGSGGIVAAALLAYVRDAHRFSTPERLAAYLSLDCRVHESGTSVHGKGSISKRGNRRLRCLFFNAAFMASRLDPQMRAYYLKKRRKGKHHLSAVVAVERKLCHVVWAVWRRGTPYVQLATSEGSPFGMRRRELGLLRRPGRSPCRRTPRACIERRFRAAPPASQKKRAEDAIVLREECW